MTKVRYSLNWMGPVSIEWYRARGLLQKQIVCFNAQPALIDTITQRYCAGRIDVDDGTEYGDEIGVPAMLDTSWQLFGRWLETFETDFTWTLEQLVEMYERANPKICWAPGART